MRALLCLSMILPILGGCASEGPRNQYFPTTSQNELFSASHWKILAAQTAEDLRQSLPPGPSYVRLEQSDDSAFSVGFNEFLATELVHRGVAISRTQGDKVVSVKVEVVHHRSGPPADPYAFTFLGAVSGLGVWMAESRSLGLAAEAVPPVALATGAVIDLKRSLLPPATSTEVIVSSAITNGGFQIAGKTDVFYVQTANSGEYAPNQARTIAVVGS